MRKFLLLVLLKNNSRIIGVSRVAGRIWICLWEVCFSCWTWVIGSTWIDGILVATDKSLLCAVRFSLKGVAVVWGGRLRSTTYFTQGEALCSKIFRCWAGWDFVVFQVLMCLCQSGGLEGQLWQPRKLLKVLGAFKCCGIDCPGNHYDLSFEMQFQVMIILPQLGSF